MTDNGKRRTHILLACMPKSGSTFLSDIISEIGDFKRAVPLPAAGRREQELDEFYLQQVDDQDYVAQLHIRNHRWTEEMCQDYGITPIVLVRSLFDCVVSLRDHVRREGNLWPMIWLRPEHAQLDDATLDRMIARLAIPWYLNFYVSWRNAKNRLLITYEELIENPFEITKEVLGFARASVSDDQVRQAVQAVRGKAASRLNVGVSGRGNCLDHETVKGILELLDFYPESADDPYFQMVREQGRSILSGEARPRESAASRPSKVRTAKKHKRWWKDYHFVRFGAPMLLGVAAVSYGLMPNDLIPDPGFYGYVDDAVIIAMLAFLAGRLTKYKRGNGSAMRRRPDRASVQRMLRRLEYQ
ncbi:YkvA family protein [Labrys sp. KNU-23]|uniref:YkvA family protein n=1 Tax=Labrys sp. KNU-23 TaxID=2789216 RepID=UPI00165BB8EE|nr:YkvA family protein [Labrys sp. KNU-23]